MPAGADEERAVDRRNLHGIGVLASLRLLFRLRLWLRLRGRTTQHLFDGFQSTDGCEVGCLGSLNGFQYKVEFAHDEGVATIAVKLMVNLGRSVSS